MTCPLLLALGLLASAAASASAEDAPPTPSLRGPTSDRSTNLSAFSSMEDSMGKTWTIVVIVVVVVVAVALGAFLARKCLHHDAKPREKSFPYDPDNLMHLVGLEGVTPGPRIPSTDFLSQHVVAKVGACLICQAERASATFKQSRFFDFKLSGFSRAPSDLVMVKKIVQEHGEADDPELRAFVEEIDLMSKLDHPKIVAFLGVSWNSLRDVSMVQEYLSNGSLASLLAEDKKREGRGKPRQLAWFGSRESKVAIPALPDKASIAMDIVEGLSYLHSLDPPVVHRALSSDNVLLSQEFEAKLANIGGPSQKTADVQNSSCVPWMAPEVIRGEEFTTKSNMYAFGVILTELASHVRPFEGVATAVIVMKVTSEHEHPTIVDKECPDFICDLAERCMSANPKDRPTAAMVLPELLFRINRVKAGSSGDGDAAGAAPKPQGHSKDAEKAKNGWLWR